MGIASVVGIISSDLHLRLEILKTLLKVTIAFFQRIENPLGSFCLPAMAIWRALPGIEVFGPLKSLSYCRDQLIRFIVCYFEWRIVIHTFCCCTYKLPST